MMTMIAIVPKNPTNTRGAATDVAKIALLVLECVVETPLVLGVCTEGVPALEPWVVSVDTVVCVPVDCVGSVDGTEH